MSGLPKTELNASRIAKILKIMSLQCRTVLWRLVGVTNQTRLDADCFGDDVFLSPISRSTHLR